MPPDAETPTPLAIPAAARAAFAEHHRLPPPNSSAVDWNEVDRDVRSFSTSVVAAELRRMAEEICPHLDDSPSQAFYGEDTSESAGAARALRARADQLDPQ